MEVKQGLNESETRELLQIEFEYSFLHDDWVFPLTDALDGITADQAAWRPGTDLMGIWDIVLHIAVWNENIIERIQTGERAHPKEGAWPPLPDVLSEETWDAAKARLWKSVDDLKHLIQTVSFEKIRSSPYGFGDLTCRFIHMAYHCGQIEKLRECKDW